MLSLTIIIIDRYSSEFRENSDIEDVLCYGENYS